MAHQVSIFAENKPGRIEKITEILKKEDINIRAITISSSDNFGVIKLLVNKPDAAYSELAAKGFSVFKKEIIAVLMDDRPGGLNTVVGALGGAGINIEDAYGFVIQDRRQAVLVMEVDRVDEVQSLLAGHGLKTLSDEEIYNL